MLETLLLDPQTRAVPAEPCIGEFDIIFCQVLGLHTHGVFEIFGEGSGKVGSSL